MLGVAKNRRLEREIAAEMATAEDEAREQGQAARRFAEFCYATRTSWSRERRVIGKAEALPPTREGGTFKKNHRFIVTSLPAATHPAQELYEQLYCARGDAENRVKEHKLHLFSARCSSNLFGANTLRFYLSTFAMILFRRLREALEGTRLAAASADRIRLCLLKIGALVRISVRRVHLAMSSACPDQDLFAPHLEAPGRHLTPPHHPEPRCVGNGPSRTRSNPVSVPAPARSRLRIPVVGPARTCRSHSTPSFGLLNPSSTLDQRQYEKSGLVVFKGPVRLDSRQQLDVNDNIEVEGARVRRPFLGQVSAARDHRRDRRSPSTDPIREAA